MSMSSPALTAKASRPTQRTSLPSRLAGRLGVGVFVLFLIKGLLWLAVPGALAWLSL